MTQSTPQLAERVAAIDVASVLDSLEMLANAYASGESSLDALRGESYALPLAKIEALVGVGLEDEDTEAVMNLLVGALVQRQVVLGAAVERGFIAHSVDLVLDGAGWSPAASEEVSAPEQAATQDAAPAESSSP